VKVGCKSAWLLHFAAALPIRLVFSWYAMALGSVITSLEVFE